MSTEKVIYDRKEINLSPKQLEKKDAVLMHIGNNQMIDVMMGYLKKLDGLDYDLWIALVVRDEDSLEKIEDMKNKIYSYYEAKIIIVPNKGLDFDVLLNVLSNLLVVL